MIYTVAALKGGVAKTTTSAALCEAAALDGRNVLAVDLDTQATLSVWYGGDLSRPGSYEMITGYPPAETVQQAGNSFFLACGSADLAGLKTVAGSSQRLKTALDDLRKQFDFIMIDTAPGLSEALYNALYAAERVIIPIEADTAGIQSLYQIIDIINHVQMANTALKISGAIVTRYDGRPKVNRLVRDKIREICQGYKIRYLGEIRAGVAARESMAIQEPIFIHGPKSKPAADYMALYSKIKDGRLCGKE